MSFHEGPKCLDEGPKCLFQKGPKCPIGAEVVGAEVVGAEVSNILVYVICVSTCYKPGLYLEKISLSICIEKLGIAVL